MYSMAELTSAFPESENKALFVAILERGTFYFPAGAHYGNPDAKVICDRCKRSGIPACIGFERSDLCLPCAEVVALRTTPTIGSSRISVPGPLRNPIPGLDQPVMTLMVQDIFDRPRTRMAHDMYFRR